MPEPDPVISAHRMKHIKEQRRVPCWHKNKYNRSVEQNRGPRSNPVKPYSPIYDKNSKNIHKRKSLSNK